LKVYCPGRKTSRQEKSKKDFGKLNVKENLHLRQWDGFVIIPGHEHVESRGSIGERFQENWEIGKIYIATIYKIIGI